MTISSDIIGIIVIIGISVITVITDQPNYQQHPTRFVQDFIQCQTGFFIDEQIRILQGTGTVRGCWYTLQLEITNRTLTHTTSLNMKHKNC
jgi:hypothetical protein